MKNNTKGLLYAGFTALLWGFLAIALKVAVYELKPATVVWFRFSFAFSLLLIGMVLSGKPVLGPIKKLPPLVIIAAVFLGFNYLGFISGIRNTSPGIAQIFIQIGPVSLAIAGIFVFRESFTPRHFAGLLILLTGYFLFYRSQINEAGENGNLLIRGIIFVVLGGLSWAAFSILQKMLVRNYNPNHLNLVIYGLCSLGFIPFVEWSKFPGLEWNDWFLLAFLGLNTFLAYGSLALALKYAEANKISMIITLNPILTFICMAILELLAVSWIEYENLSIQSVSGAIIALTGVLIVVIKRNAGKNREDARH